MGILLFRQVVGLCMYGHIILLLLCSIPYSSAWESRTIIHRFCQTTIRLPNMWCQSFIVPSNVEPNHKNSEVVVLCKHVVPDLLLLVPQPAALVPLLYKWVYVFVVR